MTVSSGKHGLLALLAWYCEMGADTAVGSVPADWLARAEEEAARPAGCSSAPAPEESAGRARLPAASASAARAASPAPAPPSRPSSRSAAGTSFQEFPGLAPEGAERAARQLAEAAADLAALEAAVKAFEGCGLKKTAKNTCFYRGAPKARVFIVGEAPGREEDLEGRPFVGPAGRLLDKMLAAIGLSEKDVHITNAVYWRPPGNRTPSPEETQVCRPFLERQIALVDPEFLVLFGAAAARHVLNTSEGIMRLRGQWRKTGMGGRERPVLATLHPAYLLRTPAAKRLAWRDMLALQAALTEV